MSVEPRDDQREGQPDDPWAAARASQRDDVRAVLAPRERLCPACGAAQRGPGRTCTSCGADLTARFARWRSLRKFAFAGVAAMIVAAVAVPVVASLRDDAAGERARAAARQRALEAAERARLTRDSQPVRADGPQRRAGAGPLEHRAALVAAGESLIAEDARGRANVKGDIRGAECTPFPNTEGRRAAEQDPATTIGRYDCVAYTSKFDAPELDGQARTGLFGYPYWLVVDYAGSKLVWCKVTPRAGEGGRSLAAVPVPEPCRDPEGPG
jgi:hypothetical protein